MDDAKNELKTADPLKTYTPKEAADILDKVPGTLAVWRHKGIGPRYVKMGDSRQARISYRAQDLLTYLEENSKGGK